MTNTLARWIILLSWIAVSCQDVVKPTVPLSFRYETLNEQGQPTTVFAPGENIVLSLEIMNPSHQDYYLQNDIDVFFLHPDFMRIRGIENTVDVDLNAHMFLTGIAYYMIPQRSSYKVQILYYPDTTLVGRSFSEDGGFPIVGPPTDPPPPTLTEGTYFSSFTAQYILKPEGSDLHTTVAIPLALSFTIQ